MMRSNEMKTRDRGQGERDRKREREIDNQVLQRECNTQKIRHLMDLRRPTCRETTNESLDFVSREVQFLEQS